MDREKLMKMAAAEDKQDITIPDSGSDLYWERVHREIKEASAYGNDRDKYRQALLDIHLLIGDREQMHGDKASTIEQVDLICTDALKKYYASKNNDSPVLPPYKG